MLEQVWDVRELVRQLTAKGADVAAYDAMAEHPVETAKPAEREDTVESRRIFVTFLTRATS